MKDKLKKKERTTHISFNEAEPIIEVFTHNTDLKRRLYNYSNSYPDSCKHIETDEFGGALFIVKKGRFCFRLTKPYSEERRASAREYTIKNNTARRLKNQRKVGENDEFFETVREKIPVRAAAEYYGLKVRGGMTNCIFHNDRTPSMKMHDDHFYCFGCGKCGDVTKLVEGLFGESPIQSAKRLVLISELSI